MDIYLKTYRVKVITGLYKLVNLQVGRCIRPILDQLQFAASSVI